MNPVNIQTNTLPESLLPELRAKWIKMAGAREVVEHAANHLKALEADYQQTLTVCLRFMNLDPGKDWRIDLETGAVTPNEEAHQNGTSPTLTPSGLPLSG